MGPTGVSGGRAGVQGRRLGQRQGGQRRRDMSIQNMGNRGRWPKTKQNKKKVKEREEGEKEYILIEYKAIFTILFKKKFFF